MRYWIVVMCLASVLPVCAGDDFRAQISRPGAHTERLQRSPAYADYVYRLRTRHMDALQLRRQYNASRGPAVYQISQPSFLANPFWSGIQAGWVRQPPIPAPRPRIYAPVVPDYHDSPGYDDGLYR